MRRAADERWSAPQPTSVMRIQVAIVIALGLGGCAGREGATPPAATCPATAVRVVVMSGGRVLVNDRTVAVADLRRALEQMSPRPAEVCYARQNPEEAPPQMAEILDAIAALKLPISFYTDSSFTNRLVLR